MSDRTAVVVGAGPNGLAGAVVLARAGFDVTVFEEQATAGGAARTAELTLPGYRHDLGSAVHPMALASEFMRRFELGRRIRLITPEISYVHSLGERSGVAYRDLERTAENLGADGRGWRALLAPVVSRIEAVDHLSSRPLLRFPSPLSAAVPLGLGVLDQGGPWWNRRFAEHVAPAMLTGVIAHAAARLPSFAAAAVGVVLAAHAHAAGWPVPEGGSQSIADALVDDLLAHGGRVVTDTRVTDLRALPRAAVTLLDVSAWQLAELGRDVLPQRYLRPLRRFRRGPGSAKVDFALTGPVPWLSPEARKAVTVHLGGRRANIAAHENGVLAGQTSSDPFVLVTQPTVVDPTRAPAGKHVLWAYIHVPNGSELDPAERIASAVERHAPGFRDLIAAQHVTPASELSTVSRNLAGGDINAGALDLRQLVARPVFSSTPWRTPLTGVYLCSSSTTPGTGVHGMSGYLAARLALKDVMGDGDGPQLGM